MQVTRVFKFDGRITRKEYWLTYVGVLGAGLCLGMVAGLLDPGRDDEPVLAGLVAVAVTLVTFWIGLAASTKRLHDIGRSGWLLVKLGAVGFTSAIGIGLLSNAGSGAGGLLAMALGLLLVGLNIYLWYLVGFKRGDEGPNEFGLPGSGTMVG